MQERREAERLGIWPCLNVATWRKERSDQGELIFFVAQGRTNNNLKVDMNTGAPSNYRMQKISKSFR